MKKTFEFYGMTSGFCGCFIWLVDLENFISLTGREPYDFEHDPKEEGIYRLYPDSLFVEDNLKGKFRIEFIPEGKEHRAYPIPELIQVVAEDNYQVICFFADGKVTKYDMSDELQGVFKPLKNQEIFKNTIIILDNTLAWDPSGKRDYSDCLSVDRTTIYNALDVTDRY